MDRSQAELDRIWRSLEGHPHDAQQAMLDAAALVEEEWDLLGLEAACERVGTRHEEIVTRGGAAYCLECGPLDDGDPCDLYWHPMEAERDY